MRIDSSLLAEFYSEAAAIVATEKTLHAIFYRLLTMRGIAPEVIGREFGSPRPFDVTLFANQTCRQPIAVIEFKGGAYGSGNSLSDEIEADGFCEDMEKLEPFAHAGVSVWFICVDHAELGTSIAPERRLTIADQCRRRGINFAYHCTEESNAIVVAGAAPPMSVPVEVARTNGTRLPADALFSRNGDVMQGFAQQALSIAGSEDDYCGLLYTALRAAGCGLRQISLETYFCFARRGTKAERMQDRPDLCVFDPGVRGRFNLYQGGKRRQPLDAHKLYELRALAELKGGRSLARKSDAQLMRVYLADVAKLGEWRRRVTLARHELGLAIDLPTRYVFVAVDIRPRCLAADACASLYASAGETGTDVVYVGRKSS